VLIRRVSKGSLVGRREGGEGEREREREGREKGEA
jgi:hypothetical protein